MYRLRFRIFLTVTVCLLLLYMFMYYRILVPRSAEPLNNENRDLRKPWIDLKNKVFLSLSSRITHNFHQKDSCSIEIFGGFSGSEQSYIGGTLFRDIARTCSCYTHYQKIETWANTTLKSKSTTLHQPHSISRVVWCLRSCPNDMINWCKNETHREYCQKHVVLFDLSDEWLKQRVDHYPYFAAVYRNYLRHTTGNHLSYLTQDIRRLPRTKDALRMHRILNWSLAIDIMRAEWQAVGLNVDNVSDTPTLDLTAQLNNRILTRLLVNNEGVTYHTWPDLDAHIRNRTQKHVPVFWFPLGYTNTYLANVVRSSIAPLSARQKLWSWSGFIHQDERNHMHTALRKNDTLTKYIKQCGSFRTTTGFSRGLQLMHYISSLLESQFIPLPRGGSPEQFRSYEASDAGAISIVNERWSKISASMELGPLAYLNILGYDPVTISSFSVLPEILLQLSRLPPELLDDWQLIMLSRHEIIMNTLTKHIASVLCAANTPHGYVFKNESRLS